MKLGSVAAAAGKGLLAGTIGTAAMTASSTIEMQLRGRKPSSAPADAAAKVLGVEPVGERQATRFSNLMHWAYGTTWGVTRGMFAAIGLSGPRATAARFGAVWGTGLIMLPALDVAPPVTRWGTREIAVDAWHHAVYALATSMAYTWLDR
jgi:hypothetical protein